VKIAEMKYKVLKKYGSGAEIIQKRCRKVAKEL